MFQHLVVVVVFFLHVETYSFWLLCACRVNISLNETFKGVTTVAGRIMHGDSGDKTRTTLLMEIYPDVGCMCLRVEI